MMMNESRALSLDDAHGRELEQGSPFLAFRLSWVAYIREALAFLLRTVFCSMVTTVLSMGLDRFWHMQTEAWLPVMGLVAGVAWTVYSVWMGCSVRFFTDEQGVWMEMGVFPWQKGVSGVQWRDVGQASYSMGFLSWALRSYDIRVSNRFTTGPELYLRNVHRGDLAVKHINGIMGQLQGRVMPR